MLLDVANLSVATRTAGIVREVSFALGAGESLGIVGESGSGKSMTALALMGLLPEGVAASGSVRFDGQELLRLDDARMQVLRGAALAMIFQEPMTALNPLQTIGRQIGESLRRHRGLSGKESFSRAIELLAGVALSEPERIARAYPHTLSGGQRQRALIAMALSCEPRLIIADEPTTALDVTVQAQILQLIARLCAERKMALILVSHDLAVVARQCQRVLVMYGGRIMESGPVGDVLARPTHPYTKALLDARPRYAAPRGERLNTIEGAPPSPADMPAGCPFAPRCPHALAACRASPPPAIRLDDGREVRCIRVDSRGVIR
jgi:peptide/nickel transport system ATP-binding protein